MLNRIKLIVLGFGIAKIIDAYKLNDIKDLMLTTFLTFTAIAVLHILYIDDLREEQEWSYEIIRTYR